MSNSDIVSDPSRMKSAPPHILYIIDEMQAITAGGTERQLLQMIQLMQGSGARVQLCVLRGTKWLKEEDLGCKIHFCNIDSAFSLKGLRQLLALERWMKQEEFDIIQSFFVEANILGPMLGRRAGIPVRIGSRRNLNYWMSPTMQRFQRFSNRSANRLLANCQAVRKQVITSERIPPEKVDVIYNGLDTDYFRPDPALRDTIRKSLGFAPTHLVVGVVSVLRPVKGCELFVQAAIQVSAKVPEARFVMVGDGPLRATLETLAVAGNGENRFHFVGSQEDVRPFLNAFDLAVLPSESEGFSNSILEYLAVGLPSIVTDVGGNAEAVANAGRVVRPSDSRSLAIAMEELLSQPSARLSLSAKALARSRDFSLETTRSTLINYYGKCLRNG